jgi:translation initiation factor 6 (eIF-6)
MSQQTINIGTTANDGTGDPIRTAMTKVNNNFSEFYSVFAPSVSTNNVTVANNITVTANVISNNLYANTKLQIGSQAGYNFGSAAVIEIDASQNSYVQAVIQNANSGVQASSDLVVTADTGNDTFGYVDLGINSSTYSNASYGISGPLDAYLYSSNSQLVIGTASANDLIFHTGGTLSINERLRLASNGNIGVNNSTPTNTFSVTGTVYISANLYANSILSTGTVNAVSHTVGTSTIANSTGVYTGTVNAASHTVGTTFVANSTTVLVANTTGNLVITPYNISINANGAGAITFVGNSTVNASISTLSSYFGNTTGNTVITPTSVTVQNSSISSVISIGSVVVANSSVNNFIANTTAVTIASNTLTLGTSTKAANGYTYLPNGMKMNWGTFTCNTVSQVTFTSAFATALVSLTVTPIGAFYVGANTPYVFASNTTTANIYSVSTTTTNTAYYVAIGY